MNACRFKLIQRHGQAISGHSTRSRRRVSHHHLPFPTPTCLAHTSTRRAVLGIRREDPERIWERRCPLSPEVVERLVHEDGVEVLVQPCERRVWKNADFVKAGAKIHPTLAPADVILGIKETPLNEVLTDLSPSSRKPRTHIMFSHTHKGQKYNVPLLARFLEEAKKASGDEAEASRLPTLIDWELLTDGRGKRTVGFGWFAGVAGALEGLVSTALLHLNLGVSSPFLGTPRPHTAPLPSLLASLKRIGEQISKEGTPLSMGPYVVVVTGSGQVFAGALYLLKETLPIQSVNVEHLPRLIKDPTTPLNKIYLLHATQETYLFNRTTGEPASRQAYYADPGNFESRFYELIAPYTTLLINGVGWSAASPRLMTVEQTAAALMRVQELQQELQTVEQGLNAETGLKRDVMKGRCQSYADVSCDIEGGLGFLTKQSSLTEPSFTIDLRTAFPNRSLPNIPLPPLQMMSVDILPTSLPLEASGSFCRGIVPYVRSVAARYGEVRNPDAEDPGLHEALERATIASGGMVRKQHEWLHGLVDEYRKASPLKVHTQSVRPPPKRILLLGSGMVAGPAVEEICRRKDVELIIASDQASRNSILCQPHANATPVSVDMTQEEKVEELIKGVDVVISLLPVPFHPAVAEICIKHRRHLVTASYISPAMRALHDRATNSDVLLLNEIGLDPGIDHCSALTLLEDLRKEGKEIVGFSSFCGGLPAPECARDVPLKYKFSWSPRGVLSAALNGARFLVGGKTWTIPSEDLLRSNIPRLPVSEVLQLEGLPNRDSLSYSTTYGLHEAEGLRTLFRGTIRYPGFCELLLGFKQLGLLNTERSLRITSYSDLIRTSVEDLTGIRLNNIDSLKAAIRDLTSTSNVDSDSLANIVEAVEWLSQVDGNAGIPRPPTVATPVIDLFATLLSQRLAYKPGERDLVVLHHEVVTASSSSLSKFAPETRSPNYERELTLNEMEVHTSSLEVYGTQKHSAMAVCVGVPVALAALRVLDGAYEEVGVRGPEHPDLYGFVLRGMEERGLKMGYRKRVYVEGGGQNVQGRLNEVWG